MTPPKRILCGCGCDAPEKPFQLTWRSAIGLGLIVGALTAMFTGCTDSKASGPVEVRVDETLCNAKYANWIMRHEELAKPQPEQWHAFKRYMVECVR